MPMSSDLLKQNIIGLLGLESLPAEEKVMMLNKMTDLIQKRVMLKIMDKLKAKDREELGKLADQPEKSLLYLADKVPQLDKMVEAEIIKLKQEMLKTTEQV